MTDIETLLAEREIIAVAVRYAFAIDQLDWELFRTCFTEEVEVDASGLRGVPLGGQRRIGVEGNIGRPPVGGAR